APLRTARNACPPQRCPESPTPLLLTWEDRWALEIPDSAVVDMRSEQSEVELQITVDGQEQYCLPAGHTLRIRKHPACFKLITSKRRTFYEILREKFNWGDVWQMPSEKC
ncbi:MAG TPA: hypothetical protein PKH07_17915, partial [bacterium]|nr:hypothetical protein [bacterium]